MHPDELNALPPELLALAARLKEVEREAEKAGLFLSHRPLLQCPACGLMEDVSFEGRLLTYFPFQESVTASADTGLRFAEVGEGFRCPSCQSYVDAPVEEDVEEAMTLDDEEPG